MFCKLGIFQQDVAHCTTVTGLRKYWMEVGGILDVSFSFIQISVNHVAGAGDTTIGLSGTQTQLFENWKS